MDTIHFTEAGSIYFTRDRRDPQYVNILTTETPGNHKRIDLPLVIYTNIPKSEVQKSENPYWDILDENVPSEAKKVKKTSSLISIEEDSTEDLPLYGRVKKLFNTRKWGIAFISILLAAGAFAGGICGGVALAASQLSRRTEVNPTAISVNVSNGTITPSLAPKTVSSTISTKSNLKEPALKSIPLPPIFTKFTKLKKVEGCHKHYTFVVPKNCTYRTIGEKCERGEFCECSNPMDRLIRNLSNLHPCIVAITEIPPHLFSSVKLPIKLDKACKSNFENLEKKEFYLKVYGNRLECCKRFLEAAVLSAAVKG